MLRALGFALDDFLGLALGADEEHEPALADDLLEVAMSAEQAANGFAQVDDVDQVSLAVNVRPHLRVPAAGAVSVVDAGVDKLLHLNDGHAELLGYLVLAETIMSNLRTKGKEARPIWREG